MIVTERMLAEYVGPYQPVRRKVQNQRLRNEIKNHYGYYYSEAAKLFGIYLPDFYNLIRRKHPAHVEDALLAAIEWTRFEKGRKPSAWIQSYVKDEEKMQMGYKVTSLKWSDEDADYVPEKKINAIGEEEIVMYEI